MQQLAAYTCFRPNFNCWKSCTEIRVFCPIWWRYKKTISFKKNYLVLVKCMVLNIDLPPFLRLTISSNSLDSPSGLSQVLFETTSSYHTVKLTWAASFNCSVSYQLSCTATGRTEVYTGDFTPVNGPMCEYRQFGFQPSTTYSCLLMQNEGMNMSLSTTPSSFIPTTPPPPLFSADLESVTTLGQGKCRQGRKE